MKKSKKKWYFVIAALIIVVLGAGAGLWYYQSNHIDKTMTEKQFNHLKDKKMEVVDTSVFLDKKLEKWYYEKRQTKGTYLYKSGDSTYILVSAGKVKEKKTFLLLNGVKDIDGKLAIGYDTLVMKDVDNVKFEDSIRSTLVKVKGHYDQVHVIDVEEDNSQSK